MGERLSVDEVSHKFLKLRPGNFIAVEVVHLMCCKLLTRLVRARVIIKVFEVAE